MLIYPYIAAGEEYINIIYRVGCEYSIDIKDIFSYPAIASRHQSMFNVKGDLCMKKIMLVIVVTLFAVSMAFAPLVAATPQ